MRQLWQARKIFIYLWSEMIPTFLLGIVVFISILLMFQALRLTEFMLVFGVKATAILDIMGYMSLSFLPILLPMSLLFSILMTYNRLSQESEIIAMKGIGINGITMLTPAVILSLVVAFFSAQTAFVVAPWGNRQFEVLISQLGNTKAAASIKEGTFSRDFFNMVVYANKVDPNKGILNDLFIYDERNPDSPLTIIAPQGQIIPDEQNPGHSVQLRMFNGQIHRRSTSHTIINFDTYNVFLNDPIKFEERKKSPPSMSLKELDKRLNDPDIKAADLRIFSLEYHKRAALSVACLVFALVGVAFGIQTNRRSGKSSGFIISVGFIICYWLVYLTCEGLGRSGSLPVPVAAWLTNVIFTIAALLTLRKKLI